MNNRLFRLPSELICDMERQICESAFNREKTQICESAFSRGKADFNSGNLRFLEETQIRRFVDLFLATVRVDLWHGGGGGSSSNLHFLEETQIRRTAQRREFGLTLFPLRHAS